MPYRPCVGALVVNAEGLVWTGRRLPNEEYTGQSRLWQFPQGGIDPGEEPEPAARRELFEETSIRSVSLIGEVPDWLTYDLPDHLVGVALKGKYRGQKQRWFLYRFEGADEEVNVSAPGNGDKPEFDDWEWTYLEDVPARAVSFKVELYGQIIEALRGHPAIAWKTGA
ncbi:MAG: RNA pyrophosphohydrolase [Devosiaceae bacterium]|nr:RNA pyrophosphohydrolase [Devosiaceae bacterium MH13]